MQQLENWMKQKKKKVVQNKWLAGNNPIYILVSIAILLYANTMFNQFALDDAIVITENSFTQRGLSGIPDIFKYDSFRGFFNEEGKSSLVSGGRYRPFSLALFSLEYAIFGNQPWIFHLFNILYYALLGVIIYLTVLRLLSIRLWKKRVYQAAWVALLTAGLFLLHPVHTEVVANIKGRDEILAMLGAMLGLYFLIRNPQSIATTGLSCLFFFIGFLSKESALPFVILTPLALYLLAGKAWLQSIKASWPVFLAAGLFLTIRFLVLGAPELATPNELMNNPFLIWNGSGYITMSFSEKYGTIFYTLLKYLGLLIFPHPLTHDYYPQHIRTLPLTNFFSAFSIFLYLGLIIAAVYLRRKRPVLSYSIWIYLFALSLVSNLVFPIGTNMSERFLFIPSLGFVLAVSAITGSIRRNKNPLWLSTLLILTAGLFFTKTILRNNAWKDNYTLFSTDIKISNNSAKLRNALGGELSVLAAAETDDTKKQEMLKKADQHLQQAIKIHPTYSNAYLLLGNVHYYLKDYENSIQYLRQALSIKPAYPEAKQNLQIVYREAGKYYGEEKGDLTNSIKLLLKSYELNPQDYESLRLLGVAYGISQNHSQAVKYFQEALAIRSNDPDAHYNLGLALLNSGNEIEGNQYLQKAVSIDPGVTKRYGQ